MKVVEILIYGLGMLEFPYDESIKNCHLNASAIYEQNGAAANQRANHSKIGANLGVVTISNRISA